MLFDEIYSRPRDRLVVTVLTDSSTSPRHVNHVDRLPVLRQPIATRHWGMSSVAALAPRSRPAQRAWFGSTADPILLSVGRMQAAQGSRRVGLSEVP